jgi:hypothetical protein
MGYLSTKKCSFLNYNFSSSTKNSIIQGTSFLYLFGMFDLHVDMAKLFDDII